MKDSGYTMILAMVLLSPHLNVGLGTIGGLLLLAFAVLFGFIERKGRYENP